MRIKSLIFYLLLIVVILIFSSCAKNTLFGVVKETMGDVKINGTSVKQGTKIIENSSLKVNKGYCIIVSIKNNIIIRVFNDTTLSSKIEKDSSSIVLKKGKIWTTVTKLKKDERFYVNTVNAVAGVRGTDFIVYYDKSVTGVSVIKGSVSVSDKKGNEVVLKNNEQTKVKGDNPPDKPSYYNSLLDVTLWERLLSFIKSLFS